jgi:alkylated DNA repair dioxygenase AlkB
MLDSQTTTPTVPGAFLVGDLLPAAERDALASRLDALDGWRGATFRGRVTRRSMIWFGTAYSIATRRIDPAPPIPAWLRAVRDRAVAAARARAGIAAHGGDFVSSTIIRYPVGAGIGWHSDAPVYGPTVLTVSLGAPAWLDLRHERHPERRARFLLNAGALFILTGEARSDWAHRVPPVSGPRYALTFRTRAGH